MADTSFDTAAFFAALDAQRGKKTWRQVASESGISASTLTRIAQGKRPDVDGLTALLSWSGLDMGNFIVSPGGRRGVPNTVARISTSLRADKHLTPESATALERIIRIAYEQFREEDRDEPPVGVQERRERDRA
jgi:transcriptional regulator with XRE-family HTH domain